MDDLISADRAWIRDLEHVFKYGNRVSPRGMLVYESLALTSTISMKNPVILNEHRKLGYRFMAAEAAWILSGDDRVSTIAPYSKEISKFSDDGEKFFGAYGPKIKSQVDYVVATLLNDINSRQAVINIWRENPGPTKDVPCTLSLQFLVRHNMLHCVASMRSSDLWLGHPYDIVNFSAISFAVLLQLMTLFEDQVDLVLELGNLFLTAGSKHIYERNSPDVGMVLEQFEEHGTPVGYSRPLFNPSKYDDADEFVEHLWDCANSPEGLLTMFEG
ncbi:MAG TPA: thymidylate synthase [Candidatus Bathyarchaeia archaeon]